MARMPGAIWKPLAADWASQPRMKAYDIFCLHTMVGGLDGTDNYFRNKNGVGYGGTESHFGVGHDGTIYQWQDTAYQADANYLGNWHIISIENADTGTGFPAWSGSDVPAFTPAQVEANARIAAWVHQTHGIPLDIVPDAKVGRRGIGWHRLGVPGYMVAGAEQWSSSQGKACPGDRRIAQVPSIAARARQIAAGAPIEEDDMFSDQDRKDLQYLKGILEWYIVPDDDPNTPVNEAAPNSKGELLKRVRGTHSLATAIANKDAAAVVANIPDDLAEQVLAALGEKLAARPA